MAADVERQRGGRGRQDVVAVVVVVTTVRSRLRLLMQVEWQVVVVGSGAVLVVEVVVLRGAVVRALGGESAAGCMNMAIAPSSKIGGGNRSEETSCPVLRGCHVASWPRYADLQLVYNNSLV